MFIKGAAHGLSGILYMLIKAILINKLGKKCTYICFLEFEKKKPELLKNLLLYIKLSLNFLLKF